MDEPGAPTDPAATETTEKGVFEKYGKWIAIGVLVLLIVAVAVGLGVHFGTGDPKPTATLTATSTAASTAASTPAPTGNSTNGASVPTATASATTLAPSAVPSQENAQLAAAQAAAAKAAVDARAAETRAVAAELALANAVQAKQEAESARLAAESRAADNASAAADARAAGARAVDAAEEKAKADVRAAEAKVAAALAEKAAAETAKANAEASVRAAEDARANARTSASAAATPTPFPAQGAVTSASAAAASIVTSTITTQPAGNSFAAFQFPQRPSGEEWARSPQHQKVFFVQSAPNTDTYSGINGVYAYSQPSMWKRAADTSGGKDCFLYEQANGEVYLFRNKDSSTWQSVGSFGVVSTPKKYTLQSSPSTACNLECYLRPAGGISGSVSELRMFQGAGSAYLSLRRVGNNAGGTLSDVWGMSNGGNLWLTTSGCTHIGGPIPEFPVVLYQMRDNRLQYAAYWNNGSWLDTLTKAVYPFRFVEV